MHATSDENSISNLGAEHLAAAMEHNTTLIHLHIGGMCRGQFLKQIKIIFPSFFNPTIPGFVLNIPHSFSPQLSFFTYNSMYHIQHNHTYVFPSFFSFLFLFSSILFIANHGPHLMTIVASNRVVVLSKLLTGHTIGYPRVLFLDFFFRHSLPPQTVASMWNCCSP